MTGGSTITCTSAIREAAAAQQWARSRICAAFRGLRDLPAALVVLRGAAPLSDVRSETGLRAACPSDARPRST